MNCYACGQRVSPEMQIPRISAEEEVASILRTTQRLGEEILALNATRAKLLQRLNQLRASTTVFPSEILATIFHHASPPPIDFTSPLEELENNVLESHGQISLSAVSWHWRRVILATSQLWTHATIKVMTRNVERKAQLLQLYLTNVGNLTLSLALHISPDHRRFVTKSDLDPVITSISQGAQKFRLLSLCSLPENWITFSWGDFTQLEDLQLIWAWNYTESGPIAPQLKPVSSFPRLRRLSIWSTPIHLPSRALCQNLTTLRFFDVPLHISIQMLILSPNLVEYVCYLSQLDPNATIPQLSEPMTFSHLKVFYSSDSATARFSSILHNLELPVLEALGLELGIESSGLEELVSFIARLPTTWPTLEISGSRYSRETLETIVHCLPPHVRSLHLPDIDRWTLGWFLKALNGFDHNDNPPMLGLQRIYIGSLSHSPQPTEDIEPSLPSNPHLFLDMVSARKNHLIDGQFDIETVSDNETYWEKVRGRLEQMAEEGFKLRITMAGKSIQLPSR